MMKVASADRGMERRTAEVALGLPKKRRIMILVNTRPMSPS
jgi:hypothetical protein